MSDIEQRVKKIVAEQLGVNEAEVKNASSFVDDLGADSLDTVELVMALEDEFGTEIPDEQAEKIVPAEDVQESATAAGYVELRARHGFEEISGFGHCSTHWRGHAGVGANPMILAVRFCESVEPAPGPCVSGARSGRPIPVRPCGWRAIRPCRRRGT